MDPALAKALECPCDHCRESRVDSLVAVAVTGNGYTVTSVSSDELDLSGRSDWSSERLDSSPFASWFTYAGPLTAQARERPLPTRQPNVQQIPAERPLNRPVQSQPTWRVSRNYSMGPMTGDALRRIQRLADEMARESMRSSTEEIQERLWSAQDWLIYQWPLGIVDDDF